MSKRSDISSLSSLELPIKLLCSKYCDLSVSEFFSHYEVAFGEPLEPEKFGFSEKIGLLSKIAMELQILDITLSSCGTTKINLTKVSIDIVCVSIENYRNH